MATCLKCGESLENGSAICNSCGTVSLNTSAANAVTENEGEKKHGKRPLGCTTLLVIALVLLIPLFAIELPYPLGGSIGRLIFVGGFKSLVSGTPLGVKFNGECPASEKAQLEEFLRSGEECVKQFSGYRQAVFPAMTREFANSRHPKSGKCLLQFAIVNANPRAVKHLLDSGADPSKCDSVDTLFEQFLHRSSNGGYHDIVYALHNANLRPTDANKFLFDAAKQGSRAGVLYAVKRLNQAVDAVDPEGRTPLYHAILSNPTSGSWGTVTELISLGADPNLAARQGESPLQKGRRIYKGTKWQPVFEHLIQYETARRDGKPGVIK